MWKLFSRFQDEHTTIIGMMRDPELHSLADEIVLRTKVIRRELFVAILVLVALIFAYAKGGTIMELAHCQSAGFPTEVCEERLR